jgi:hypothetical protein
MRILRTRFPWAAGTALLLALSVAASAETAPSEFVTQILEPTGGKILRPKDWFYHELHHGPVFVWTLSREDSTPYTTGVSIQTLMRVREGTGKTARQFILDFAADRKSAAARVIKSCEPTEQYLFTRLCLETEEGPYHVLYSLFWATDGGDIAVVSIAGTTRELWDTYAPTFEKMGTFEIIDMKRFEK